MAAPVAAAARVDPSALDIPLYDGHPTKVALNLTPAIAIWENSTTPPGVDGGDPIEATTFFNTAWRTFFPRALKTMTEMRLVGEYDPVLYDEANDSPDVNSNVIDAVNRRDTITVFFSDGSTLAFYGYLRAFNPQEHTEGSVPLAEMVIQPTNWDHVNNVEAGPAMVEASGT